MHHTTTVNAAGTGLAGDYTWPACAGCNQPLQPDTTDTTRVCWTCQDRTDHLLAELPALFTRLNTTAALIPAGRGTRSDTPTSSSPIHAPIPLRLDTLNLATTGGIPTRLQAIDDSWRTARRWTIPPNHDTTRLFAAWRINPTRAVTTHTRSLRMNLSWACTHYDEIAQDLTEIRRLHTEATTALSPDPRPRRIQVGTCPTLRDNHTICGAHLTASLADQRIRCSTCGARWGGLAAWRELRQAQDALRHTAAA